MILSVRARMRDALRTLPTAREFAQRQQLQIITCPLFTQVVINLGSRIGRKANFAYGEVPGYKSRLSPNKTPWQSAGLE